LLEDRVELLPVDAAELAPVARRSRVGRLLAGELLEARPRRDLGGEAGGQLLAGDENVRHESARRALLPELGDRRLVRSANLGGRDLVLQAGVARDRRQLAVDGVA